MQFIGIERGMAAPDMIEIENPDDLFDVDLLPVIFRRPTEQAQIIANGRRQIASLDVVLHARAFIAFTHLRAVLVQDQRNVGVMRRRRAERAKNLDVLRRIREMIFAANDVRDFHLEVVDHIHEMKNP